MFAGAKRRMIKATRAILKEYKLYIKSFAAIAVIVAIGAGCGPTYPKENPWAIIDASDTIGVGSTARLNGENSRDYTGQQLTYAWSLDEIPKGSETELNTLDGANTSFFADKGGYYVVRLSVTNTDGTTRSISKTIDALGTGDNHPPVAMITVTGSSSAATTASLYMLDGSASYDIDGDTIYYNWSVLGSYGATYPVADQTLSIAFVTALEAIVKLRVNDGTDYDEAYTNLETTTARVNN